MKISGFSFARNASKLYYPMKEAVQSILPIVDEFVVALGKGDEDDTTRQELISIGSSKVKIIDTVWDPKYMHRGAIHARETDLAKSHCSGDWLFYLQADEVIHEKYLDTIYNRCNKFVNNERIEGLLFGYKHFWGDYEHYHRSHGWYPFEVRIVRNNPNIHSWESAQSFRYYENYESTHQREGTRKLRVALSNAEVYHYGWVRPPHLMRAKSRAIDTNHKGKERANQIHDALPQEFDYGPLDRLEKFSDTHPLVMEEMISKMNWKDKLHYSGKPNPTRMPHKHERFKYRAVTFVENTFLGGRQISSFKNYELIKNV